MKKFLKIVGGLFVLGVVASAIKGHDGNAPNSSSSKTPDQTNVAQATPAIKLPNDEAQFIGIVQKAQQASQSAENDLQKGGVRATREKELCSALGSLSISNWVGEIYALSSNSDGKGVLAIKIAPDAYVQTWNNSLSDITDNTLIDPNSPLFTKAAQLKEGQTVKFSGSFFRSSDDSAGCLSEGSMTLDGKLSAPEFIFRFADVVGQK
jgi:hypothetical protein